MAIKKEIKKTNIRETMRKLLNNKSFIRKFLNEGGTMEELNKRRIKLGLEVL